MAKEKTFNVVLEGETLPYEMKLFSAIDGFKIGVRLSRIITPIVMAIVDHKVNEDIRLEESKVFSEIAAHLVMRLDEDEILDIVNTLFAGMYYGSHEVKDWGEEFAGRYGEAIYLIERSLRENFGDFFTKYFKEKGLSIPSLKEILALVKGIVKEESNEILKEPAQ